MQKEDTTWFASWFDSPYYHVLYKDRDDSEAADFMNRLTQYLHLHPTSKILDLACGKGRHSRYLSSLGYDVTGVDLSSQSITFAKKFEKENSNDWLVMPIVPFGPYEMDYANDSSTGFSPPSFSSGHFCGTDKTERDVFARLLYGLSLIHI